VVLGPLLGHVPLRLLQFVIGVLLLLFGMRWLRKAILRSAGVIPLHDEATAFATETAELREQARRNEARLDWLATLTTFKAVLLEGLEVVFIVIALSAGHGMLLPASAGALAACLLVAGVGCIVHHPLARVPENTLKFAVSVMLSAFVSDCQRCGGCPGASPAGGGFVMTALANMLRELAGLFVDDGALAIIAIVALAGIVAMLSPDVPLAAGAMLLFGCLGVLLSNVARPGQR
jgi:hypothetical protein